MYAVNTGDEDCVKLLLMERDLITEDGVTAWYLAYKVQSPDLCMILRPTYDVDSKERLHCIHIYDSVHKMVA